MSEEKTQNIPDGHSFEERVFARFDAMDRRFDRLETRVQNLGVAWERRDGEEKLRWERLLAEILKVRQQVDDVEEAVQDLSRSIDGLSRSFDQLHTNLSGR